jgi:hypothetical protein
VLFNVYLEEAIKSSKKLDEVRSRGDLLAFADDMLGLGPAESPHLQEPLHLSRPISALTHVSGYSPG